MEKMAKKILVLRFGALGDLVHTTIIPQAIKAKYPDYEIHYCSEARYVQVLKNNPYIDKIIEFDHKRKKEFYGLWMGKTKEKTVPSPFIKERCNDYSERK